ncbi:MAG: diacylglycerol kinase family lipid kinase [Kiritimatiellaceae bacterium]|nr:diacylglycerol kinase family lipid kinase [Kiritimatiellaceae bacterium]
MLTMNSCHKVRILINPNSGLGFALDRIREPLIEYWDKPGADLSIQFSLSKEDGQAKALKAVQEGVEKLLVVGGDGMVNSIGSVLVGTNTALGVIPSGSGNGFARHFDTPLDIAKATQALATAKISAIDVGYANEHPFFVTCSLAWDAALVDAFEKFPVRGVLPYIFAGVSKFFGYAPQPFSILIDQQEQLEMEDPLVCTIANLSQYGGGAQIAPNAQADDGQLQLVTLRQRDLPWIVPMLGKLFDGTIDRLKEIQTYSFQTLTVYRKEAGPMQLDGELVSAPAEVTIRVRPQALKILIP